MAIRKSGSVENKRDKMAYNTFRWTLVISIRQTPPNFRRLLTPYFASTATRLDIIFIYRMSLAFPSIPTMGLIYSRGTQIFGKANSSRGVKRSKSFLSFIRSNSSPTKANDLMIEIL